MQLSGKPAAVAFLQGGSDNKYLQGTVQFYQRRGGVLVVAKVSGLPRWGGFFGFHIHEGNACTGTDFATTGGHFNPVRMLHPNHAGDLPPLLGCNGNAYMSVETDRFAIRDVIGRTVVIHSDPDDFITQPAGNAGRKIACGVIRKM